MFVSDCGTRVVSAPRPITKLLDDAGTNERIELFGLGTPRKGGRNNGLSFSEHDHGGPLTDWLVPPGILV